MKMSFPRLLLHLEGLAVALGAGALYFKWDYSLLAFLLLLLTPDLGMIGYLVNPKVGSQSYNLVHTYTLPIALGVLAYFGDWSVGVQLALIWCTHIGADRLLGYGLKYPTEFKDSHLQRL